MIATTDFFFQIIYPKLQGIHILVFLSACNRPLQNKPLCLPLPPSQKKKWHKHCFKFLLGRTIVPREEKKIILNNAYAKFGDNKECYGIFLSGLLV